MGSIKKVNIVLSDFGLSSYDKNMTTRCGSANYTAPEVINEDNYAGPEVDVWSL